MIAVIIITSLCFVSVFISYVAFRKGFTKSADDYFVAGSSLGYFVLIFSFLASFLSAFSMFGMSSFGYRLGYRVAVCAHRQPGPPGVFMVFHAQKNLSFRPGQKMDDHGSPVW
jgi:solute:Na+ symporter, SSS family